MTRRGERREAEGGPVGAGLAPRQPALQRGDRAARREGRWNALDPIGRQPSSRSTSKQPELAGLLPVLYPGVFPNLAALHQDPGRPRRDPAHGHPAGVVSGFQNYTGTKQRRHAAAERRHPADPTPNALGVVGGDLAGYPNGRRVFDDVVIDRAAGDRGRDDPARRQEFMPRRRSLARADGDLTPGTTATSRRSRISGSPHDGYDTPSS